MPRSKFPGCPHCLHVGTTEDGWNVFVCHIGKHGGLYKGLSHLPPETQTVHIQPRCVKHAGGCYSGLVKTRNELVKLWERYSGASDKIGCLYRAWLLVGGPLFAALRSRVTRWQEKVAK